MSYLIKNANIYDTKTKKYLLKDILISQGSIIQIDDNIKINDFKTSTIDAEGLIVVPGFIDIHTHEDTLIKNKMQFFTQESMLKMGVTTVVGGNCGFSPDNLKEYFSYIDSYGCPTNIIMFAGYNNIRGSITNMNAKDTNKQSKYKLGNVNKILSNTEIDSLEPLINQFMKDGALGLSFGLEYMPGTTTDEVIRVINMTKKFNNSISAAHYRYDSNKSIESLEECIQIAKSTEVPFIFSHIGSCSAFGYMKESLQILDNAISNNINIIADCYPYDAFSTLIGSTVFDDGCFDNWNNDENSIFVTEGKYKNQYCNKDIFNYLRKYEPDTRVVCFAMNQDEIELAIKNPNIIIASDGKINNGHGHPRGAGTFPRVLGNLVREKKIISFENAIDKMTIMPAEFLGLKKKGQIKVGFDADITILDKDIVKDNASYNNPTKEPDGIKYVFVNGVLAYTDKCIHNKTSGKAIRRDEINK